MNGLLKDLKFGLRHWSRNPGGTLVILGTLTLLMSSTCFVLAIINYETHRWMPFPDPDRVVTVWNINQQRGSDRLPARLYGEGREKITSLETMAVSGNAGMEVLIAPGLEPKSMSTFVVSPSVFKVCGIAPQKGRVFTEEEARLDAPVLVISHEVWQSHFLGAEDILEKEIRLGNRNCRIIGVMPEHFDHNCIFYGMDIWKSGNFESPKTFDHWWRIHGRLKEGATLSQLNTELNAICKPLMKISTSGRWKDEDIRLLALRADKRPGFRVDPEMFFALCIPIFVVGIAGFNMTNILLSRLLARRHEFAVRFAMGASRKRLVTQLLTECVLLALIGGALGMIGAKWVSTIAQSYELNTHFSPGILAVIVLASMVIGLIVGLIPALRATRGDLHSDIKDSSRTSTGGVQRHRMRTVLVVGQVALATAMCIAAGLLVKSYMNRKSFDPGFDTSRMIRVNPSLQGKPYETPTSRIRYFETAIQRIEALPGVEAVSLSSEAVINRYPFPTTIYLEDQNEGKLCSLSIVSPNHLDILQVPVLKGRGLSDEDKMGGGEVMLVSQSFEKQVCVDRDPIGMRIKISLAGKPRWLTIVGVVADRPNLGRKKDIGPEMYVCFKQFQPEWSQGNLLVVTESNPGGTQDGLRDVVRSIDPNVPVGRPVLVDRDLERAVEWDLNGIRVVVGICVFGMIMALLGIYGVVAYSITQRTHELGIRLSLGATHALLLKMILKQGLRYAMWGLAIGIFLGAGISQLSGDMVYDVHPLDPSIYVSVCAIMLVTTLCATLFPALRTMRIDPMVALRYE